jgi:hypothetical protein
MTSDARSILEQLEVVERERAARAADPMLAESVVALKDYQQRRFASTYADLLSSPRYAPAARFFLDELYGPRDFSARDAQFARVVPALVRLFPAEIVSTVQTLADLHALSETLDTLMARRLKGHAIDRRSYVDAWQHTGDAAQRERQIALTLVVGSSLDRLTRKPLLRGALHMMRGPARAAGLPALQEFLEVGFDTFKAMKGASEFLSTVGSRERALAKALFSAHVDSLSVEESQVPAAGGLDASLGQLP